MYGFGSYNLESQVLDNCLSSNLLVNIAYTTYPF